MGRVPLVGGFYKARSVLAGAQRCVNLYPERNQEDAPFPFTLYPRPGMRRLAQATDAGSTGWRGLYLSGVGGLYGVCGANVYKIDGAWNLTLLGAIGTTTGQVSFSDNRLSVVLVDGSANGWVIDPFTNSFQQISAGNGAFYGANRVRYVDTFFVFNRPSTNQWYVSLSEVTPAMLTGGPVVSGAITGGSGYSDGTHVGVSLTGGSGDGATAEVTVAGGTVASVFIVDGGENYRVGDVLGAAGADLGGGIATGAITTAGTGYADATYTNIALTGGAGSGAEATVVVSGGAVTTVTITAAGGSYAVSDVLSADPSSLGGTGSGFTWTVATVDNAGSGFAYALTEVGSSAFDPLDIAAKTGASDDIVTLDIMYRYVWLFGARFETELWCNAGTPDFAFARLPGTYVENGCAAMNSVAHTDVTMFWLGKNKEGKPIAFAGENNTAVRISTYAIEAEWAAYAETADAIGFVYQKGGHSFYQLTFPSQDTTWVYDMGEKLWHEEAWVDDDGVEHRHRANCCAFAFDTIVVGDFENGNLYALDFDAYDDDGQPITWRRGFPHLVSDGKRVSYAAFQAEIATGTVPGTLTTSPQQASLRWSDTRGASWGDPRVMPVGSSGQYLTAPTWRQLGMARDRVFELFGEVYEGVALGGAWVDAERAGT